MVCALSLSSLRGLADLILPASLVGPAYPKLTVVCRVAEHDLSLTRWRWSQVKQAGARPSARSGMTGCLVRGDSALFFGGQSRRPTPPCRMV